MKSIVPGNYSVVPKNNNGIRVQTIEIAAIFDVVINGIEIRGCAHKALKIRNEVT
jgi:hypothetical protein